MRRVTLPVLLSLTSLHPQSASADVYKYVSPSGNVYYTDEPPDSRYKLVIRSSPSKRPGRGTNVSLAKKRRQFDPLIKSVAARHRLDPRLLHAVIRAESAYNAQAVSKKGAVGLMQLMPETAKRYGVSDRRDPSQNVEGGARYLRDLIKLFNRDLKLAIAAYNAGENAVKRYKRIPPFPETQHYVKKVLELYRSYSSL